MPDHRDLYLLVAGVLAGLLLGPAVLGRLAPDTYDDVFVDVAQWRDAQKQRVQDEFDRRIKALETTGATGVAQQEVQAQLMAALKQVDAELSAEIEQRLERRLGWILGLGALLAIIMIGETLIDPTAHDMPARIRSRLVTTRYALVATCCAIILAQPALLRRLPATFIALAAGVALIAIAISFGISKRTADSSPD